ncbi:hypothetical protein [Microvirga flocculans]|nr:hypothetical protein [Microvirga flocculans]
MPLIVLEAQMAVFLLDVMGAAAIASAIVAGIMASRLSREMAGVDPGLSAAAREHLQRDDGSL